MPDFIQDRLWPLWLNRESFTNFCSEDGVPLTPVHYIFKTGNKP